MKIIVTLAQLPTSHYVPLAAAIEAHGFGGIHLADHLAMPTEIKTVYPYRGKNWPAEKQTPWPQDALWQDCWVIAGAMAAVTKTVQFYTGVYILPLRHPVHAAKAVGTAADVSNGRIVFGIGSGWLADEFEWVGQDFDTRGRRMNEDIAVMRGLWAGRYEHHGEFYDFPEIDMLPRPAQPVPIYLGGASPIALKRVARIGDGFMGFPHRSKTYLDETRRLAELRAEYGRSDEPFEFVGMPTDIAVREDLDTLAGYGVDAAIMRPWPEPMNTSDLSWQLAALDTMAARLL